MATQPNEPRQALMLFDGVCNFCSGSVLFILKRSQGSPLRFVAMQTPAGQAWLAKLGLPLEHYETFALVEDGKVYEKSQGVLRLTRHMSRPWPVIGRLVGLAPRRLLDWLYDRVARNRYRILGRKTQCFVPTPAMRARFLR